MTENQWNSNAVLNAPYSGLDFKKGKKKKEREKEREKGKGLYLSLFTTPLSSARDSLSSLNCRTERDIRPATTSRYCQTVATDPAHVSSKFEGDRITGSLSRREAKTDASQALSRNMEDRFQG